MPSAKKLISTISEEEYLKGELSSEIKHEYIDGYIYAMAGASKKHNLISRNILYEFENNLRQKKSPCTTFISDMKVKTSAAASNNYLYPDVMVVCDISDSDNEYYQNSPAIIVEVLSKSTRKNDHSKKMISYFNIPALEEYVLIEQDICEVQVFRKSEHWKSTYYFLGDKISFQSINVTLTVEDIYYQVENEDILEFLTSSQT
jgi:Uma2 family endonuclease